MYAVQNPHDNFRQANSPQANSRQNSSHVVAAVPAALLVTGLLLFLMAQLISSETPVIDESPYPKIPPVVMEPPKPTPPMITKPDPVERPQPLPPKPVQEWTPPEQVTPGVDYTRPELPGPEVTAAADSLPFARVMAPPVYPFRAAQRGIEGFVDVRFDVSASGATQNIQVVYAEPEGTFEKAATAAIARWRFQPRMVGGNPQPFVGLSKRIRFTLQK